MGLEKVNLPVCGCRKARRGKYLLDVSVMVTVPDSSVRVVVSWRVIQHVLVMYSITGVTVKVGATIQCQ